MVKQKIEDQTEPPVVTGYDERPEKRSKNEYAYEKNTEAPDGISGNWS